MSAPIRVLELRSVWGTGGGPDKTILNGTRRTDTSRFRITVCYIRDKRDTIFSIDQRARALGLDYVEVLERHSFDPGIWPQLRRLIRERSFDIVHSHDHKTDALAWALAKVHPIIPLATAHGFAGRSRNERIYYAIEKRLLATFPRVIAVSNPIKAELVRTGSDPNRVAVINNGIDPEMFQRDRSKREPVRAGLGIDPGAFVVGAVGRLEDEKRFDLLINAIADLRTRHPNIVLVIVGEGSLRPALEAQIAAMGLADGVRLAGHRADVADLHATFDVFVQSSEREGTPNAVLEAMALESPVVATDVGGTGELMKDGEHGFLVPRHDTAALISGIERTLQDPAGSAARVAAARRRVETDLSFAERMRKVERVYDELVAGGARR
ncbi:MAG TPA: glycosyltransferase [Vicinamibacterales bacterium]|nr:glycosyltransferase [Vicinamibacterales bacterium]